MRSRALKIWCNTRFQPAAATLLAEGLQARGHQLLLSESSSVFVQREGASDASLAAAQIVFGQPALADCLASKNLRWLAVSTAGYDRYDTYSFREALLERGIIFSNASSVFADPCAQHALMLLLALYRRFPQAAAAQHGDHSWGYEQLRFQCRTLTHSQGLLLGYGAIARRLTELLRPFSCRLSALRRSCHSEQGVRIIGQESLSSVLAEVDWVINLLPSNEATHHFMNARRFACLRRGAFFINIGRGATVDSRALTEALDSGHLSGAGLDVFESEPLPAAHPLWGAPNCLITPHIAGGRSDQDEALVLHFLENLDRFSQDRSLLDRVF